MRTQEEIIKKLNSDDLDMFGFMKGDLLSYLDYENVKKFLKEDSDLSEEEWKATKEVKTPKELMIDYMPFAWEKANNFRGLSAMRSLCHYAAWTWLDGADDLHEKCMGDYEFYGKDLLIEICDYLGLNSEQWDDGVRSNGE